MTDATSDTIVLIHGLWMTPRSWEHWVERYTEAGYRVIAPAWPGLEGEVDALRTDPSPLTRLDVAMIVDHYERIIRDLDRPPMIIGHSFGGTFVQLLLDRGLGAAGVAIASSTVRGVRRLPLSTLRVTAPVLRNPANRRKAVPLTPDQFRYAFCNTMPKAESRAAYDRYHVPAAANVLFQGAFANLARRTPLRVDFANHNRAPLLFMAGGEDHVIPAAVNRENARRYRRSSALTAYREFPGRSHFTVGQPGWEEVADYALAWALNPTVVGGART
ncbi:alpha/beta hydrolase [Virgisporangium ochraceum]|uniref:Alpha/beta hydrolase n=1 Tax=Virgisporangium ochraceum TaxID=65505 RepID=A0A8J4E9Z1_9ACTN|nr:alpha/beta fold hydrolase [Virgisporangium ochraceum]GIJ67765.1 alpha/beta hydrolase [Virgisporangium ochraceum]